MKISQKAWKKYLEKLNRLDTKASNALAEYFRGYDVLNASENDLKRLLDCAYALATYYGEGAGELACEMYDAIGIASGKILPPAEPAPTATYGEVAKAVQGAMLKTQNPEAIGAVVGTKVKTVGLDTMLKNSLRDGAEFAWVPAGDTCPFCMMLASNGWQRASKKALKNGHAEHVHNNCDCTYAIRFDENTEVEGYDPDYYKEIYDNAEGHGYKEKINSMRRANYADNKDQINEQKRLAYTARQETINQQNDIYNGIPKSWRKDISITDDVALSGTNPNYTSSIPQYLEGTKYDYTNNCTNSVVAYSQRLKGYNVTASSVGECSTLRHKNNLFTAWEGRTPINAKGTGYEDIITYMNNCKDGTLVAITVQRKAMGHIQFPGHAFVAIKRDGKIIFLDPQSGGEYNINKFKDVAEGKTFFMRVDDLELSDRGISSCKGIQNI